MTLREQFDPMSQPAQTAAKAPERFGFLLLPLYSILPFSSALEPLRAANRRSGKKLYDWALIGPDKGPCIASAGVKVLPDVTIESAERFDTIIVVAGLEAEKYDNKQVTSWLRRQARQGTRIGSLSTGSYALARAGLLDGYRCTLHWENIPSFREDFPNLEVTQELFEIDRNRFTCSGGTAALDLMLSLITLTHGRQLATAVAEQYLHERIRDPHDPQRMALRARLNIAHPKLLNVIALMEGSLEEPLARSELAKRTGLSTRQLERLFRKYLKRTPTRYYLELRLQKAKSLLNLTAMSVLDVALAAGFVSASHFSKCYREQYGKTPREERAL